MCFIQQYIEKKKFEKEEKELKIKNSCSASISILDDLIPELRNWINHIASNKKDISDYSVKYLLQLLSFVNVNYSNFVWDLNLHKVRYERPFHQNKNEIKEKIDYMMQKKKEYRVEFESIYNTFKRVTKGVNFPRRNEILGLMRKAFDFDSSKYYQKNIVHEIQ